MSEDYTDREQSQIKHFALRSYLEVASKIIGSWRNFCYVDCCAGPWESRSSNYGDTSFGIAIRVLFESGQWLRNQGKTSKLRSLLIEEKAEPFKQLSAFAENADCNEIAVQAKNWDFRAHIPEIINYVANPPSFAFFFIDPTGWNPAKVSGLEPLLATRPSEVLINFMSSFIVRFLNDERTNMDDILGTDYREIRSLPHEDQEDEAVRRYCELIRRQGDFEYVCALPVMKPNQDAIHFYLIYGTRNAKGVDVFKQVEKKTEEQTHLVRALLQQSQRDTLDLFEPDVLYKRRERYRRLAFKGRQESICALESLLSTHKNVSYDDCWAEALQFPTVYETDLRQWLMEREKTGSIRVEGRKRANEVLKRNHGHVIVKL